jgi:hypothetical protein
VRHYEPGGQLIATDGESMCSINHVSIRLTMDGKQQKSRVKAHNKIDEGFIRISSLLTYFEVLFEEACVPIQGSTKVWVRRRRRAASCRCNE